jgi:hypothetical protein
MAIHSKLVSVKTGEVQVCALSIVTTAAYLLHRLVEIPSNRLGKILATAIFRSDQDPSRRIVEARSLTSSEDTSSSRFPVLETVTSASDKNLAKQ